MTPATMLQMSSMTEDSNARALKALLVTEYSFESCAAGRSLPSILYEEFEFKPYFFTNGLFELKN